MTKDGESTSMLSPSCYYKSFLIHPRIKLVSADYRPYHVSENSTSSRVSGLPMSGSFLSSAESCAISSADSVKSNSSKFSLICSVMLLLGITAMPWQSMVPSFRSAPLSSAVHTASVRHPSPLFPQTSAPGKLSVSRKHFGWQFGQRYSSGCSGQFSAWRVRMSIFAFSWCPHRRYWIWHRPLSAPMHCRFCCCPSTSFLLTTFRQS